MKQYRSNGGHCSPLVAAFDSANLNERSADFGVLWDFGSLFQKPRTDAQTSLFKKGLGSLPMWYGHAETTMWMQPDLPDGFGERMLELGLAQTYEDSGWCYVESSVSAGVKHSDRRLNLGLRTETALRTAYGGQGWNPEFCLDHVCTARRPPPMLPEAVVEELTSGRKKFTSNADVEVVAGLYRSYFEGITSTVTRLTFEGLQWGDTEAEQLAAVLPRFTRVKQLNVSVNGIGPAGARALAAKAFNGSLICSDGHEERVCLDSTSLPELQGQVRAGTLDFSSFKAQKAELQSVCKYCGCAIASHALKNSSLTAIEFLCNQLDVESANMLARVAKRKGVSLCAITPDTTSRDLCDLNLKAADAVLLASDLSQPCVSRSLTKLL